jgi:hypothetical protein
MTFGELIANLLGWLGEFIQWTFGWVPRYFLVHCDELGVKRHIGDEGQELRPGLHWYIPNLDKMVKHWSSRCVLRVASQPLETADGIKVEIGLTIVYRIRDIVTYETANYDADDSMDEVAQGALAALVNTHEWKALCAKWEDDSHLGKRLRRKMDNALADYGVEVLSVRPAGQVRLGEGALRLFGLSHVTNVEIAGKSLPA